MFSKRAVVVTWSRFFEMARVPSHWKLLKENNEELSCKNCLSVKNDDEDLYEFDTVDSSFHGEFVLCANCIKIDLDDYLNWWLDDAAQDWADYRDGDSNINMSEVRVMISQKGAPLLQISCPKDDDDFYARMMN